MSKKAMTGAERKAQMLEAGAKLASKHGAVNVTRKMVAEACKCAEGLVTHYLGDSPTAQKAYARKAKALGLTLPDKATAEAIGVKLRAHGPRDKRDSRVRSAKEKVAIAKKRAPAKKAAAKRATPVKVKAKADAREVKPTAPRERKPKAVPAVAIPSPAKAVRSAPERKASAARKPKAAPVAGLPLPLPPMPDNAPMV